VSLRVNPDVDADTHPYISTGLKQNKFGIDVERAHWRFTRAPPHRRILKLSEWIAISARS
jgi:diaminopimelate decarboxylase